MSSKTFSFSSIPCKTLVAAVFVAGAAAASAAPAGAPPAGPACAAGMPAGGPMGGPSMGPLGGMPLFGNPHMLQRLLDDVDATTAQRKQIREIVGSAFDDMGKQRADQRRLSEQMAELFAQPSVDAKAVEALRQQMLAQHDKASQRMTQAMLDASHVLNAEQRKEIAERLAERREALADRHERGPGDRPRR
ncbi:Spy/CpxP family protein refolding chaperone [Rubrivivax gelatinosus]|uniref:Spy/CpxP family protein refolding chaperone n=1 Tax=Rubrivivax gelatinosus TaxID=28068 RepID=A0ABS1DSA8_RUBGE|nr:Spy/CpxP family protein refolding chaperone [Rubrivivax gelatinosus]MBK1712899.1 hypothetical protein [Rubrivivax gelatinosus]